MLVVFPAQVIIILMSRIFHLAYVLNCRILNFHLGFNFDVLVKGGLVIHFILYLANILLCRNFNFQLGFRFNFLGKNGLMVHSPPTITILMGIFVVFTLFRFQNWFIHSINNFRS